MLVEGRGDERCEVFRWIDTALESGGTYRVSLLLQPRCLGF